MLEVIYRIYEVADKTAAQRWTMKGRSRNERNNFPWKAD